MDTYQKRKDKHLTLPLSENFYKVILNPKKPMYPLVQLDGETVNFTEPLPKTLYEILYFIIAYLDSKKRALSKITIDDKDYSEDQNNLPIESFSKIQLVSQDKIVEKNVKLEIQNLQTIGTHLEEKLLVEGFDTLLNLSQELVNALQKLLGYLKESDNKLSQQMSPLYVSFIQEWLLALEKKDVGVLYDLLQHTFFPLIRENDLQFVEE